MALIEQVFVGALVVGYIGAMIYFCVGIERETRKIQRITDEMKNRRLGK